MNINKLEAEIISYIKEFQQNMGIEVDLNLNSNTLVLESVIGFDSLELAGLVVHLEELTGYDPFEEGFIEFVSIRELAELFSSE